MARVAVVALVCVIFQLAMKARVGDAAAFMCTEDDHDASIRKIDTHCHFVPSWYKEFYSTRHLNTGIMIPDWNATAHLEHNVESGISSCVLSVSTPGAKFSKDDPVDEVRALARKLNEYAYNLTEEYPAQFLFFGALTLPDVDGSVEEAIYALDTLHAAGVTVAANEFGELFGTPRYAPLYKVLNDRKAVVFIHPNLSPCPEWEPTEFIADVTDIPHFVVDFLLDTTRAATNLVYRNVTSDYPDIKFILAHSGGFLPFAGQRVADALALISRDFSKSDYFYKELQKFNVDLALSASGSPLAATLDFFDKSQITFGSDYPFDPPVIAHNNLKYIHDGFTVDERQTIYNGNAYKLFEGNYLRLDADVQLCGTI